MREFLKELYHWKSDWCVWSAMILFLIQLRFYIWIIPASVSSVQIHFWLVVNVTSYLVFSLQSDLIWSSVFYMALIGILKVHVWRLKEKLSDILPEGIMWRNCSGWNSHSGNYEMWEQYAALYLELWEKFLFYFYMIYQKLIQEPLENLFTSLWNGTIKKTLINISEAMCVSEEYSQAQTNLLLNLDIWPSGCQAINDHL